MKDTLLGCLVGWRFAYFVVQTSPTATSHGGAESTNPGVWGGRGLGRSFALNSWENETVPMGNSCEIELLIPKDDFESLRKELNPLYLAKRF